jgi:hypothetical protein
LAGAADERLTPSVLVLARAFPDEENRGSGISHTEYYVRSSLAETTPPTVAEIGANVVEGRHRKEINPIGARPLRAVGRTAAGAAAREPVDLVLSRLLDERSKPCDRLSESVLRG